MDAAMLAWMMIGGIAGGGASIAAVRWSASIARVPRAGFVVSSAFGVLIGVVTGRIVGDAGWLGTPAQAVLLVCMLLALAMAVADALVQWVPLAVAAACIVAGLAAHLLSPDRSLVSGMIGAVIGSLVLLVLHVGSRWARQSAKGPDEADNPVGVGDVWVGAAIGAVSGWPLVVSSLMIGALLAAGVAVVLLVRGQERSATLPLGTCLCAGALISVLRMLALHIP